MKCIRLYVGYKGHDYVTFIPCDFAERWLPTVEKHLAYRQLSNKCYYWYNREFLAEYELTDNDIPLASKYFWKKYGNDTNMEDAERHKAYDVAVARRKENPSFETLSYEIEIMMDYITNVRQDYVQYRCDIVDYDDADITTYGDVSYPTNFKDGVKVTNGGYKYDKDEGKDS